jgi:hypothetical protein
VGEGVVKPESAPNKEPLGRRPPEGFQWAGGLPYLAWAGAGTMSWSRPMPVK